MVDMREEVHRVFIYGDTPGDVDDQVEKNSTSRFSISPVFGLSRPITSCSNTSEVYPTTETSFFTI